MTFGWQEDATFKCLPDPPQGTFEQWREAANMLCAAGCEAQTMILLASFAAPLMALFPTEGAPVISIWGAHKRGKRTAIVGAASVWGILGEVKDYGEWPGIPLIERSLLNRDPNVTKRRLLDTQTQTTIITASGSPLLGAMFLPTEIPCGVEFEVRVPKALREANDKNRIESQLRMNRGHAGPMFVERLVSRLDWVEDKLAEKVALMRDQTGLGATDWRFPMRAIAACWVAAIMASEWILDVDPTRIANWAMAQAFTAATDRRFESSTG